MNKNVFWLVVSILGSVGGFYVITQNASYSMVDLTKTEKEKLHHIVDEIGGVKIIVAVVNQQTKEALMSATLLNLIK